MRQFQILYKRARSPDWGILRPDLNKGLYDRPEVNKAVEILRQNPTIEAICVRLEDELFNLVVRANLSTLEPNSFPLE